MKLSISRVQDDSSVHRRDIREGILAEAGIKAAGKLRTEGRDYVMRENDVCHFLVGK